MNENADIAAGCAADRDALMLAGDNPAHVSKVAASHLIQLPLTKADWLQVLAIARVISALHMPGEGK